jgi:hypothetical protein
MSLSITKFSLFANCKFLPKICPQSGSYHLNHMINNRYWFGLIEADNINMEMLDENQEVT